MKVKLSRPVQPDELEQILVDAAKEIGYKAEVVAWTRDAYKLDSVERVQEYFLTKVKLRKWFIPLMEIWFDKEYGPINRISLHYGPPWNGFSTRGMVENYLAAVSERL